MYGYHGFVLALEVRLQFIHDHHTAMNMKDIRISIVDAAELIVRFVMQRFVFSIKA